MSAVASASRRSSEPQPVTDRRIPVRRSCRLKSSCHGLHAPADAAWADAMVCDISTEGLGLVLGGPVDTGTVLELDLQNTAETDTIPKLAHVARVSPQADGSWLVGCRFVRMLSDAELTALLAQPSPAAELRRPASPLPPFPVKQAVLAPMRWTFFMLMVLCLGSLARSQFEPDWLTPGLMLVLILAAATVSLAGIMAGWVFRLLAAALRRARRPAHG